MVNPGRVVAIVPARGGSKSVPHKNIRPLGGHPLLAYSIAAGQQARWVERVIVSTDDPEIAGAARAYGAEVPFLRPAHLAQDDTTDLPVFEHAVQWLEEHDHYRPDMIVQLRPTSPFRPPDCVDQALELLAAHPEADAVRTVVPSGQNPYKMWRIRPTGSLEPLLPSEFAEPYNMPRQALPATYWQTGHLDALRYDTLVGQHSLTGRTVWPLLLDPAYIIDIDTLQDFDRAEWLLDRGQLTIVRPAQSDANLADIRLLVLDFDGVLTDNRVLVHQDGTEAVWCHRGDGWGLARLRESGLEILVLSTETNPVVGQRCAKLKIGCVQGVDDKLPALQALAAERGLTRGQVAYVGNDLNDLACLQWVGHPIAVADAVAEVRQAAAWTTAQRGGYGAVREVCERILTFRKG